MNSPILIIRLTLIVKYHGRQREHEIQSWLQTQLSEYLRNKRAKLEDDMDFKISKIDEKCAYI